ncbi:MAG: hypothetical protein DLM73_14760 [Chthoniobacterales bacterium]|nr:MAG: hypothetical protein DLM73_14760 [Chthoniobacterales bacterium]
MTMDDLRSVVHKAPFQPFTIHLADAHQLHVSHPDFIALAGGGASAVVTAMQSNRHTVVDISLITRIEVPAVPRPPRRKV